MKVAHALHCLCSHTDKIFNCPLTVPFIIMAVFSGEEHISSSTSVCKMNSSSGSAPARSLFIFLSSQRLSAVGRRRWRLHNFKLSGLSAWSTCIVAVGLTLMAMMMLVHRLKKRHCASIFKSVTLVIHQSEQQSLKCVHVHHISLPPPISESEHRFHATVKAAHTRPKGFFFPFLFVKSVHMKSFWSNPCVNCFSTM